jgi:hypothetical protein
MRYADGGGKTFAGPTARVVVRKMTRAAWMEMDQKGPYMREVSRRCHEQRPGAPLIDPATAARFLASLVAAGFLRKEE